MTIFEAFVLGAVQGITEFLPVSSSGHLVLFQRIFGTAGPALLFDTLVHGGTLIAVFVVLWRDIWDILKRPIQPLTAYLILATLPTVAAALLFKDSIETAFTSGAFLGAAFLITSVLLFLAEFFSRRHGGGFKGKADMNWLDAPIIGLLQGVAIIPGVSRSGATLSGALSRKLNRDFAARFSFLLSIPAILGALVLQLKELAEGTGVEAGTAEAGISLAPLLAGTLTAALVGFFSIRIMLKIVRERSLTGFAVYTAILGLLVLADQLGTHFFFEVLAPAGTFAVYQHCDNNNAPLDHLLVKSFDAQKVHTVINDPQQKRTNHHIADVANTSGETYATDDAARDSVKLITGSKGRRGDFMRPAKRIPARPSNIPSI
jgi:undecaprenyl-diphosphatase